MKHRRALFALLALSLTLTAGCRSTSSSTPPSTSPAFDVPSLMGKNIDQVKTILGTPVSDKETARPNGSDDNNKNWKKDGIVLIVAFHKNSRKIENFFVSCDTPSGMCSDEGHLLQTGALERTDSRYRIEFVQVGEMVGKYAGVKATPN